MVMMLLFSAASLCRVHAAETGADTFSADEGKPKVTSVSISPGSTVVSRDATCAFTASVSGENNYSRDVAWSVSGQTSQNTFIDGNGILNVASDEEAASLIVKAVSRQDSNFSATALVSVQTPSYYIELQASPENGGSVFGGGAVQEGGYTIITAVPGDGFVFAGWLSNGNKVSQDERYAVDDIRKDATYVAEFNAIDCRITVNVNDSGFGTATESKTIKYGENITLEAVPKDGYQFESWTENGNVVGRDAKMQVDRVTGDRTFTAVFQKKEIKKYTITASVSSAGGTVVPEGSTTVTEGSEVMYTITPKSGFAVRTVYVDGKELGNTNSFRFTDVRENHTISADFVEVPKQDGAGDTRTPEKTQAKDNPENKTDQTQAKDDPEKPEAADNSDNSKKKPVAGDNEKADGEESKKDAGEETEAGQSAGTLAALKVSVDEARRLIETNRDAELLAGARDTGGLCLIVHNDFMEAEQGDCGVSHLEEVPGRLLSGEEKLEMLQGSLPVTLELTVKDTEGKESQETKDTFEERKLPGMEIGRYFEISLRETKGEETRTVPALAQKLQVTVRIPEPLTAQNRRFYILRLYTEADGSKEFTQLPDEDDDPDTITFSTDKFSPCAIAYIDWETEAVEDAQDTLDTPDKADGRGVSGFVAAAAVVLGIGMTALLIWVFAARRKRG